MYTLPFKNYYDNQVNPDIMFDFTHPVNRTSLQTISRPLMSSPRPQRSPVESRKAPGNINWSEIKAEHHPSQFGPHYWYMLHNMSLNYQMNPTRVARQKMRAFVEVLPYLLPCRNCSEHAKEFMASADLNKALTNRKTLFTFMWNFHNHVNKRLGKPQMSFKDALELYKSK